MDIMFDQYLDQGTRVLTDLLSSSDMSDEERQYVSSVFSNELKKGITSTKSLKDIEVLIHGASLEYVDRKISSALLNSNLSFSEAEKAIQLCYRQKLLLQRFSNNNWETPFITNTNLDYCIEELRKKQDSDALIKKVIEEDAQIDDLFTLAASSLSIKFCSKLTALIKTFGEDIALCRSKGLSLPKINNKDIRGAAKRAEQLSATAERKDYVYKQIIENEQIIASIVNIAGTTQKEWERLLSVCKTQTSYITESIENAWEIPDLKYSDINEITARFRHYLSMGELDRKIADERVSLRSLQQYQTFFEDCDAQKKNIDQCTANKWEIPSLTYKDPVKLSNKVHKEKKWKARLTKFKRLVYGAALVVVLGLGINLYSTIQYRKGKVQIPFDSTYTFGKDPAAVYSELENAGFTNITYKESDEEWYRSNIVLKVEIKDKYNYTQGEYVEPNKRVVIEYSSKDRMFVTDMLKGWENTKCDDLEQMFTDAGFTNIKTEEVATEKEDENGLTASVTLNKKKYDNEECYIPKDAPIVISYYKWKVSLPDNFIGLDYKAVIKTLESRGFTNISTRAVTGGWAKGNKVVEVLVGGGAVYDNNERYDPDTSITVKYSSNDRVDITSVLSSWEQSDYESVIKDLKGKGFTHLTLKEISTADINTDHKISKIVINNDLYTGGSCYLQQSAPITIEYYIAKVSINQTADEFKGKSYKEVVADLEKKGFNNIKLLRSDNLVLVDWWDPVGTVRSFTVNGTDNYGENQKFKLDDPIVIVVNTFEGTGCEEITESAKK